MKYYVYCLINPLNNQPFYIGKGSGDRAYIHAQFRDNNKNPHKDNTIRMIQSHGFEPLVEFLHENIECEELAYQLEDIEISRVGIANLTNICQGSKPPNRKGMKQEFSDTHRQNLSRALKGKSKSVPVWNKGKTKETDERLRKMAQARSQVGNPHQIGRKASAQTIEKIRESLKGREVPEDQRKKMSAAKKGKTWEEIFGPERAAQMRQEASKRKSPRSKSVMTPDGSFESVTAARLHYGIAEATVRNRCLSDKFPDWRYE